MTTTITSPAKAIQDLYGPTELWPILEELLEQSRNERRVFDLAGTLKKLYGPAEVDKELRKHKPVYRDDSRLGALTVQDGCFCFDGISISHTTARALCVPQLLNDTFDSWNRKELDKLIVFIRRIQYSFQYCLGHMFHYSVLYLVRSLAKSTSDQLDCSHYKPAFTPVLHWAGRDTYCAIFLWVASIYHNPEREQEIPMWYEFSQITGLDRYQQWQYLEYMRIWMFKNKVLSENITMMARHGFMRELPIKIGEAWWDKFIGQDERAMFQRLERNREDWPARRLPEMSSTATEGERFAGLLPGARREYRGNADKMGYHGPIAESEPSKSSVPPRHDLLERWMTSCIPSQLYGLPEPPSTSTDPVPSKTVDRRKRWYKTEVWRGPTTMY